MNISQKIVIEENYKNRCIERQGHSSDWIGSDKQVSRGILEEEESPRACGGWSMVGDRGRMVDINRADTGILTGRTLLMILCSLSSRLLIKNGNSIDTAALYDSYEVEYLPNEGLLSSSRHLFIELTTDATGTSTGIAIRYQGKIQHFGDMVFIMLEICGLLLYVADPKKMERTAQI